MRRQIIRLVDVFCILDHVMRQLICQIILVFMRNHARIRYEKFRQYLTYDHFYHDVINIGIFIIFDNTQLILTFLFFPYKVRHIV